MVENWIPVRNPNMVEMDVDRRCEGLTKEGFPRDQEVFLSREDFALLCTLATAINYQTPFTLTIIRPEYQERKRNKLKRKVRVIKTGDLYDGVFVPLLAKRHKLRLAGHSEDYVEEATSFIIERTLTVLNQTTSTS